MFKKLIRSILKWLFETAAFGKKREIYVQLIPSSGLFFQLRILEKTDYCHFDYNVDNVGNNRIKYCYNNILFKFANIVPILTRNILNLYWKKFLFKVHITRVSLQIFKYKANIDISYALFY